MTTSAPPTVPQVPTGHQVFLDHVGWMVPDLDACSRTFERLGFPLTPFSIHGDRDPTTDTVKPIGTANRLAMLQSGYLEFLALYGGVTNPSVERMKASMARHVGVHLCALTVSDAAGEVARLKQQGFALNPTINLRRTIEAADGSRVEVAFTVIRPEAMPEGRIQMLTQHTPEHMWQARYIGTTNGIDHLSGLVLAVDDPQETAARIGRFANRTPHVAGETLEIRLDRGILSVMKPALARDVLAGARIPDAPAMAAVTFRSDDLDKTRSFLSSAGIVPWRDEPERIIVDAADAMGAYLIITPA